MIDLDTVDEHIRQAQTFPSSWAARYYNDVPALVTELRAAREVIDQLPHTSVLNLIANGWDDGAMRRQLYDVANARDAYIKVVGS
jgi:hypothetical protein